VRSVEGGQVPASRRWRRCAFTQLHPWL